MNAYVTLRYKVTDLTEEGLESLKAYLKEEHPGEISNEEAIIYNTIEWLASGDNIGHYIELAHEHGVLITNREAKNDSNK